MGTDLPSFCLKRKNGRLWTNILRLWIDNVSQKNILRRLQQTSGRYSGRKASEGYFVSVQGMRDQESGAGDAKEGWEFRGGGIVWGVV